MSFLRRFRSVALRGGASLIGGTVVAQAVTLAALPFLSRMYSAEDFGFLALVTATASLAIPVVGLRLESALMLPVSDRAASALFWASAASSLMLSGACWLLLEVLFAAGGLRELAELPYFSLWVGGIVFLSAIFILVSQFALRFRHYGAVARRSIYQSVSTACAQLFFFLVIPVSGGLVAGYGVGRLFGTLPLVFNMRNRFQRFSMRLLWLNIREYWRFPLVFAPSALLNALGLVFPVLFVGIWFSVGDAGQWGMANQVLAAPALLVATAAGQVVETEIAASLRKTSGRIVPIFARLSAGLTLVGAAVALAALCLAPPVFAFVLGPGWEVAAQITQGLALMTGLRLIAVPLTKILVLLQRSRVVLFLDALRVVLLTMAVLSVTALDMNVVSAAWGFSATLSITYIVTWLFVLIIVRRHDQVSGNQLRSV